MNKLNKIIYSILILLIFVLLIIFVYDKVKVKEYIKEYNYFNEITIIKIWTNKDENKIFKDIDNIYKKNSNLEIENKEEYLNNLIKEYLDSKKINKYYINMNDTILLNGEFKVGLPDPYNELNVLKVINAEDKCISTVVNTYNSVTVISDTNCESLAMTLIQKDVNDGLNIVNNMDNVEAIWYYNKEFTKSNNFKKYE